MAKGHTIEVGNDIKPKYLAGGTMGIGATRKGSQTTGRSKGIRPSQLQRYMCRANRSYKHPDYERIMQTIGERKAKK